jgi:hypothetical protein
MKSEKFLLLICCIVFSGYRCCDTIKEDGKSPLVTIDVFYKDSHGNEIEKKYTTDMIEESEYNFTVLIPKSTKYTICFAAYDPGCIYSMDVEKKVGIKVGDHFEFIEDNYTRIYEFTGDPNCPQANSFNHCDIAAHNDTFIVYGCSAGDYAGHWSDLRVWVCGYFPD